MSDEEGQQVATAMHGLAKLLVDLGACPPLFRDVIAGRLADVLLSRSVFRDPAELDVFLDALAQLTPGVTAND